MNRAPDGSANDSAFPYSVPKLNSGYEPGISRREWFIGQALEGAALNGGDDAGLLAARAIMLADEVMKRLK